MSGEARLAEDEREAIENAWIISPKDGPSGADDPMYLAVEAIIGARLAPMLALADEWEGTGGPSRVAFLVAADELRTAALCAAAGHPHAPQPERGNMSETMLTAADRAALRAEVEAVAYGAGADLTITARDLRRVYALVNRLLTPAPVPPVVEGKA